LTERYRTKEHDFLEQNAKSAESVIALCEVTHDAHVALSAHREYLKAFREQNKLTDKGTFSQHCTIGKNSERLLPHAKVLPSSWYALYLIARLDDVTFKSAVEGSRIHPLITQRDIKGLAGKVTAPKQREDFHIVIDLVSDDAFTVVEAQKFQFVLIEFLRVQHSKWNCVVPDIRRSKALDAALGKSSDLATAA
jgi:hypothetical protein